MIDKGRLKVKNIIFVNKMVQNVFFLNDEFFQLPYFSSEIFKNNEATKNISLRSKRKQWTYANAF